MLAMNDKMRYVNKIASDPDYEHIWVYSLIRKNKENGYWDVTEKECVIWHGDNSGRFSATDIHTAESVQVYGPEGTAYTDYSSNSAKKVWFSKPNKQAAFDVFANVLEDRIYHAQLQLDHYQLDLSDFLEYAASELKDDKEDGISLNDFLEYIKSELKDNQEDNPARTLWMEWFRQTSN